ncbi:PRKR-interacting protein 1 [Phytophthora citrophthora]|uniref:PRKR-interacting protein 1 n=1 Tax=Phytophthora citrophthora TaxID=4793 RepID=A0AAD9GZX5_9STRA|nr:PRKR-interacting protein 1 [Phytophthora citrophthora]
MGFCHSQKSIMGRYTSTQTFSDQDAQGAAVAYNAAAADSSATAIPVSGVKDDKLHVNRVDNVSGSSAGAGSGDFHTYRAARRREMERVAEMEQRYKENKAQRDFDDKRKRSADEFDAKMLKRAEKRRRRKERSKAKALDAVQEEEKKEEPTEDKKEQVPETPGGVPEIPNDGSFLEKMLALQKKK